MGPINILVVDDDPDIRNAIEIFLKSEGYGVWKAEDGREALRIVSETEVHRGRPFGESPMRQLNMERYRKLRRSQSQLFRTDLTSFYIPLTLIWIQHNL